MSGRCAVVLLLDILQFFQGGGNQGAGKTPAAVNETNYEENPRGDILMKEGPVFQPEPRPRIMKTNIKNITKHVAARVVEMGFTVFISTSNKSKSRYLEILLTEERRIIVRISDHPSDRASRSRYKFDIHAAAPRRGSVDYIEFLDAFKQIVGS